MTDDDSRRVDEIGSAGSDDVAAQNLARPAVRNVLDEPGRLAGDLRLLLCARRDRSRRPAKGRHPGNRPANVRDCAERRPLARQPRAGDRGRTRRDRARVSCSTGGTKGVLDFGTTGRLRHSDLVMYDRQTESWWQQATGEAIVGARLLVVFWAPGTASVLDESRIASGRDVGASGVFDRRVGCPSKTGGCRTLTFERGPGGTFRDRETASTWSLRGRAVSGPLRGSRLTAIPSGDYFWFAWAVFRPETRVWQCSRGEPAASRAAGELGHVLRERLRRELEPLAPREVGMRCRDEVARRARAGSDTRRSAVGRHSGTNRSCERDVDTGGAGRGSGGSDGRRGDGRGSGRDPMPSIRGRSCS